MATLTSHTLRRAFPSKIYSCRRLGVTTTMTRSRLQIGDKTPVRRCLATRATRSSARSPQPTKKSSKQAPSSTDTSSGSKGGMLALAILPAMFVAWAASDHILGNRQLAHNEALRQDFEGHVNAAATSPALESNPTLFHCVIRRTEGFTHCLSGCRVGDVVEVVAEGVGPGREYNLCRLPPSEPHSKDTVGWFPIRWLQTFDDYDRIVQDQQQQQQHQSDVERTDSTTSKR